MKLRRRSVVAALDADEAGDSLAVAVFTIGLGDTAWNPSDPHAPIAGPAEVRYVRQAGSVTVGVYDVHMNATPSKLRCHCGRPVPASSTCGCCCAEHEDDTTTVVAGLVRIMDGTSPNPRTAFSRTSSPTVNEFLRSKGEL